MGNMVGCTKERATKRVQTHIDGVPRFGEKQDGGGRKRRGGRTKRRYRGGRIKGRYRGGKKKTRRSGGGRR